MNKTRVTAGAAVATAIAATSALTMASPASANTNAYASQSVYTAACPGAVQTLDVWGTQITARTVVNKAMGAQCTGGTVLNQAVYIINYYGTILTSQGAAATVGDLGYTYSAQNIVAYSLPRGARAELHSVTITNGVNSRTHVLRIYESGRVESFVV